ncbi:MAG: hypothetical protein ACM3QY_13175 [Candidatus Levyibacteriota bacterium]
MDATQRRCGACRFFTGSPAALERAIPGLNILSSAWGSVRADTGLCGRTDTFVTAATAACATFSGVQPQGTSPRTDGPPA